MQWKYKFSQMDWHPWKNRTWGRLDKKSKFVGSFQLILLYHYVEELQHQFFMKIRYCGTEISEVSSLKKLETWIWYNNWVL